MSASVWRRIRVRLFGYGPLLPGINIGRGIRILSTANDGALLLASRHPRWSITWLWFVRVGWGRDRMEAPWWRRFRGSIHRGLYGQAWLCLGWCSLSVHWQPEMAIRPGRQGYDRDQFLRYCKKCARERAAAVAETAYRAELARMLEPTPQDETP